MDRGDGVGKEEPLDSGVCSGCHSSTCSVERERVTYPGVATLDRRVLGEEEREVRIMVDVQDGELMMFDK